MLKKVVQLFILVAGGMIGYLYIPDINQVANYMPSWLVPYFGLFLGALIFFFISLFIADYIIGFLVFIEEKLVKVPVADLLFGSIGLVVGLLIAFLINTFVQGLGIPVISGVLPVFLSIILAYLGFQVGFKRRNEFAGLLSKKEPEEKEKATEEKVNDQQVKPKILDTSVIIDGRIADICETKFLKEQS